MFNEAKGATSCVNRLMRVVTDLTWPTTVVVVDDGSRDRTATILKIMKRQYGRRLQIVTHVRNQGYGAALVSGIKLAAQKNITWCLFMDSDLTNPPDEIPRFINAASKGAVDAVKASRYMAGGKMIDVPFHRRLISSGGNLFGRMCYRMGLHDYSNGFRMVKTSLLAAIPYSEPGFAIILEEMYYLKKARANVMEIPSILTNRTGTVSTFRYNWTTIHAYLIYAIKAAFI
jgi:dolichol-phosphate mannosyltransferase